MGSADLSFAGLRHLPLGTSRKPQTSRKPGVPAAHLALPVCSGHRLMFPHLGKLFILLGVVFLAIGLWLTFAPHVSLGKFGRLPGDIHIKRDNFTFYFPFTTCILVSLLLTLLFSILSRK